MNHRQDAAVIALAEIAKSNHDLIDASWEPVISYERKGSVLRADLHLTLSYDLGGFDQESRLTDQEKEARAKQDMAYAMKWAILGRVGITHDMA